MYTVGGGAGDTCGAKLPLVVAVVPRIRVRPRVVSTAVMGGASLSLGDGGKVSGLGVLHLGRLDGHSVVDDRDVVGARMVSSWRVVSWGIVSWSVVIGRSVRTALGLSDGSKVGGLGVLHLGCVDWDAVVDDWDGIVTGMGLSVVRWGDTVVGSGMSGKVSCLGVLDLRCVDWDAVVDLDGRRSMSPRGCVRLAGPQGSLVQMVQGTGFGVCVSVGDLGGGYFGCVVGHSVRGDSMGPGCGVRQRGGYMGVRDGWCGDVVGVRDGSVVRDWGYDGMVVFGRVNGRWSDGQVGGGYLESVHGIGGVLDGLHQTVSVDVRVSTVGDTVGRAAFVLLRVGVGVSIRVRAMVILADVLAGDGGAVRQSGG